MGETLSPKPKPNKQTGHFAGRAWSPQTQGEVSHAVSRGQGWHSGFSTPCNLGASWLETPQLWDAMPSAQDGCPPFPLSLTLPVFPFPHDSSPPSPQLFSGFCCYWLCSRVDPAYLKGTRKPGKEPEMIPAALSTCCAPGTVPCPQLTEEAALWPARPLCR